MNDRPVDYEVGAPGPVEEGADPVTGVMNTTWNPATDAPTDSTIPSMYDNADDVVSMDTDADTSADDDLTAQRIEVERTRSEMSDTINEIQERLSPSTIAQDAKDAAYDATIGRVSGAISNVASAAGDMMSNTFGGNDSSQTSYQTSSSGNGIGSTIVETIRSNPIPAAMLGFGAGWLILRMRGSSSSQTQTRQYASGYGSGYRYDDNRDWRPDERYGYRYAPESTTTSGTRTHQSGQQSSGVGGAIDSVSGAASDTVHGAQQAVGNAAGTVQDTAGQMADQIGSTANQVMSSAQSGTQQAGSTLRQLMYDQPLAVGAAAVALGAAVGLLLPETPQEDQLMGDTRQSVVNQAQQTAQDTMQKVGSVAGEALGAAKDTAMQEAKQKGLTSS